MQILMSVWGGRAESGSLRVDMLWEGREVTLDYEACDYYDGARHHELLKRDAFRTTGELAEVDRESLYQRILRDLKARGGMMDFWARTLRPEELQWP